MILGRLILIVGIEFAVEITQDALLLKQTAPKEQSLCSAIHKHAPTGPFSRLT